MLLTAGVLAEAGAGREPRQCRSATLATASSRAAISSPARAPGTRRSPWSVPGWPGGGEEVDEQLVDALSLVVVHPVRGVGQPLDAVEVGHVVVVGLGEFLAEVAIALAPDDQGGGRDRAECRFAFSAGSAPRTGSS